MVLLQQCHQAGFILGTGTCNDANAVITKQFAQILVRTGGEVGALQGLVQLAFLQQSYLTPNLVGSAYGVTCYDNHLYASDILALVDGLGHIGTNGVGNAHYTEEDMRALALLHCKAQRSHGSLLIGSKEFFHLVFGHTACNLFTTVEQQFGSTLDVLHNRTVGFLDAGKHVFCLGRKRLLAHYLGAVAQLLVVEAHRVEPHQQGTFGRIADRSTFHGERCCAVDAYAKGKFLAIKVSKETMFDHRHAVLRQRACLVGADHRCCTHRLTSMQLAHQVVLFQHLAHTQCKAHGDAHRQSLGHSHHNQRNGQHQ